MLSNPIWILAAAITVLAAIIVIRRAFRRFGSPEERLTMTVWAALGPFSSADDAEDGLRRSVRAVFGTDDYEKHAGWVQGHAANFRLWEGRGSFDRNQEFMRQAFLPFARGNHFEQARQKVKMEAQKLALEAMNRINQDLEATGHRLEAEAKPAGTLDLSFRQTSPGADENLTTRIVNSVGHNLLTASSNTGVRMREFLMALSRSSLGRDPENAEEIGRLWLSCYDRLSENPKSETTTAFRALNDAWWKEAPPWAEATPYGPKTEP